MHNLNELRGQSIAKRILESYLRTHPPPLLILCGPEGTGRWSAAEAFIQQHLCEVGTGCGHCADCQKILRGEHPDFIQFPEDRISIGEPANPEVFTVRWLLQTRVRFTPFLARMRFVLFPRADLIQHEAETALLKTLEEPPDHTRFIFLVRDLSELKETISSRGVIVPFQRLSGSVIRELVGSSGMRDLDLLGGSLHMLPFMQTDLFHKLKELIAAGLKHPKSLAELEQWIMNGERKKFSEAGPDDEYDYGEVVETMGLLMLNQTADHVRRREIARAVFALKSELHRDMVGSNAAAMGRFFFELAAALFPERVNPPRREVHSHAGY